MARRGLHIDSFLSSHEQANVVLNQSFCRTVVYFLDGRKMKALENRMQAKTIDIPPDKMLAMFEQVK